MKHWKLVNWVEKLSQSHVLVLGDVMLDRFVYGDISRISPEAPVPVLRSSETRSTLGGAGNVVRNLLALGARSCFVSVVGDDSEAEEIKDILVNSKGIESTLVVERDRKTTVKTRFLAGRQQVLRVDRETTLALQKCSEEKALGAIREFIENCDVVVLSDYGKGTLSPEILRGVVEIGRRNGKTILIDPKGIDFTRYRRANILTPNLKELGEATHLSVEGDEGIVDAAKNLINSCELEAVLATRSQEGMSLVQASGEVAHFRAEAKEVFDVMGAGDTVIAVLAAVLGAGGSLSEAAELSNIAAGIVVSKVGTAVVYPRDLIQALHHRELSSAEAKVLDITAAVERVDLWRRKGYKIGFTNGVFDLLHPGHLSLLFKAKKVCDRLIVGVNGDISVRQIKGEEPIQGENARSAVLASLEVIDMVIIFEEDTPIRLLEALRPNLLIKGGNYTREEVIGADLVRGYGGEIVLVDLADIYKTNSKIVEMTNGTL